MELYLYDISTEKFKITYELNGGTGTLPTDLYCGVAGEDGAIPEEYFALGYAQCSFAKVLYPTNITAPPGQVFVYWTTDKDGLGDRYYPGDLIQFATAKDLILYAQYVDEPVVTYTITYEFTDGTTTLTDVSNPTSNVASILYTNPPLNLEDPSKTGYAFSKWKIGDTVVTAITEDNFTTSNSITVTGVFTENQTPPPTPILPVKVMVDFRTEGKEYYREIVRYGEALKDLMPSDPEHS